MFARGERATCPECNLGLRALADLPPSLDAEAVDAAEATPPDEEDLGWLYLDRGRGALLLLSVVGLGLFAFAPWLEERAPEIQTLTGLQFARLLPWIWAGGVGWVTLFVLVLTRRTVYQMRGSRLAVALLAAMVLSTVVLRFALPIPVSRYVPRRFSWGWGMYGAGALALVALFYAWHFGGKPDELESKAPRRGDETLH
ncbi:MAG: hypothetical protein FJ096_05955 [Deltaproteobacteria bacterium]|nr:hypothetical protein [Deltaproteobacteria bacterium]